MADIVPTKTTVVSGVVRPILLGENVSALGQILYFDSSEGKYKLAQSDGTPEQSAAVYMALDIGPADSNIRGLQSGGRVDLGITLSLGLPYILSTTLGGIAPVTDLAATNYTTYLGIADGATILNFLIHSSRVQYTP